jgi:hypothetical protein
MTLSGIVSIPQNLNKHRNICASFSGDFNQPCPPRDAVCDEQRLSARLHVWPVRHSKNRVFRPDNASRFPEFARAVRTAPLLQDRIADLSEWDRPEK